MSSEDRGMQIFIAIVIGIPYLILMAPIRLLGLLGSMLNDRAHPPSKYDRCVECEDGLYPKRVHYDYQGTCPYCRGTGYVPKLDVKSGKDIGGKETMIEAGAPASGPSRRIVTPPAAPEVTK